MTTVEPPPGYRTFLADTNMNYQLDRFLGAEQAEEVTAIARRIHDYTSWASELTAAADRLERLAEHPRAARYVRAAEFVVAPGDPTKKRSLGWTRERLAAAPSCSEASPRGQA